MKRRRQTCTDLPTLARIYIYIYVYIDIDIPGLLLTVLANLALRVLRERPNWQVFGMSTLDMTTPSKGAYFILLAAREFLHSPLPNRPQEDGCFFFEV